MMVMIHYIISSWSVTYNGIETPASDRHIAPISTMINLSSKARGTPSPHAEEYPKHFRKFYTSEAPHILTPIP